VIALCSCGEAEAHIVARRMTADGYSVVLFDRGGICGGMGTSFPGVPFVRPRTPEALSLALRAGWLFMGEVCLYDTGELPALYAAARKVAARHGLPGDLRAEMAREAGPRPIPLTWVRLAGGVRRARLPRLMWPGTWVEHSSRGYEVLYEVMANMSLGSRSECALAETGIRFARRTELDAHLRANRVVVGGAL
jgi:hypothetical protein